MHACQMARRAMENSKTREGGQDVPGQVSILVRHKLTEKVTFGTHIRKSKKGALYLGVECQAFLGSLNSE